MKLKWTRTFAFLLALMMAISLSACTSDEPSGTSNSPSETGKGEADTTVAVGTTNSYLYFNPAGANQCDSFSYYMLYSVLFDVDKENGGYYSPVSDDWGWEDDTTLRITVKDGITFASGKELDANDIWATFMYNIECGNQNSGKWDGFIDWDNSYVTEDGKTIYLKYYDVYGGALAEIMIPILEDEFVAEHADNDEIWWNGPDGSGPYTVKETVNGSSVTYALREDYWDTSKTFSFMCVESINARRAITSPVNLRIIQTAAGTPSGTTASLIMVGLLCCDPLLVLDWP